ncbi:MAG: hypothetical protein OEW75_01060 [Cyclobacteriaceae bacterium]|nr:hypothetical protein [Cyclobacteriaceae bacterium]
MIRYTQSFLNKLEDLISETDYILRYEKGNFKPGYCIIKEKKIIIINKYYPTDGKINCLIEIIRQLPVDVSSLSEKNKQLFAKVSQTEIQV